VLLQAAGDALQQVLAFGVAFRVAGGGGRLAGLPSAQTAGPSLSLHPLQEFVAVVPHQPRARRIQKYRKIFGQFRRRTEERHHVLTEVLAGAGPP
jgi:hypothetical protein